SGGAPFSRLCLSLDVSRLARRMKTRTFILIGVSLLLVGVAAVPYLIHRSVQSRIGPQHIFELSEQPKYLTEEVATTKALETLTLDGLDIALWQEVSGSRQVVSN